ncbi:MAG TPA: glycoside hydrolase/phage tail family protein [Methyloceanibacter sp.]|nr:glycoside hydrolase/phage tail family protein [Methyloceanibacter sp.]
MATLVLGAVGSAVGGALFPGGLLGTAITGAALGGAAGAIAGGLVDQALFGPLASGSGQTATAQGPRLYDLKLGTSSEGTPLPRVYGRARLPGQLIWATRFREEVITRTQITGGGQTGGGKGNLGGDTSSQAGKVEIEEYRYYANVAYALCEGPITRIGRIWADGREINRAKFTIRIYRGSEDQIADSLIAAKEGGLDRAPAYRGTAYAVFDDLPLARFGNRLPQFHFEVFRAVDEFEPLVRAVTMIPAAGEFIYHKDRVIRIDGGRTIAENLHTGLGGTDWTVSLDQLEEQLPNARRVSLVVSWFGTDLRIGQCEVKPGVEVSDKVTQPYDWSVSGIVRSEAYVVTQHDGRPAYGGTPADRAVIAAIQDLKARGFSVVFYPFLSMDVPHGNALPDPYTGTAGQPAYPWRGRITCDPAPGEPGSVDKTSACASQVSAFVGNAAPGDFTATGSTVSYSGPEEWSYRRFILHYAHLCALAGGVDAFLIGSEMRGATRLRSSASNFPFVNALVTLAADVRNVLGAGTKIAYAADWSEFTAYVPPDGSGDVFFHLDPLWASAAIDAVGIDIYWPLSDWRDGEAHLDRQAGFGSIYDLNYLRGNIRGGEGFDWYYPEGPSDNQPSPERLAQQRLPITDGAYGKPWVFRPKAILEWWQNQHFNRPGGIESASPTAWVPESKPIWFTELGCPAIDKGSNQPNVFIDPKSAESFAPYFSRKARDDLIQRRYLLAFLSFFDPSHPAYVAGSNPVSAVYDGRMVDPDNIYVYTWDARPYPAFPYALSVWADGGNWELGHWLTGRVGGGPLAAIVRRVLEDYGFTRYDASRLYGFIDGFVIDRIMSAREALQPLSLGFLFDAYESAGLIQFAHRGLAGSAATLTPDDLVETEAAAPLYTLTRGQETELPLSAKITYIEGSEDYAQAAVEARRLAARSERVSAAELPIVTSQARAQAIAEGWLQDAWAARERASFALPPSLLALEPSDVITLDAGGRLYPLRITETHDGAFKSIEARSIEPANFDALPAPEKDRRDFDVVTVYGPTEAVFLDLPLLRGDEAGQAGYITAYADPWPGSIAVYRSPTDSGFELNAIITARPTAGKTLASFWSGPLYRYDRSNVLIVKLDFGALASVTEEALLNGANYAAIENQDGEWELIQFATATLIAPATYELSLLLRGMNGTERAMRDPVAAGARFVVINSAVASVPLRPDEVRLALNYKFGPADDSLDEPSYGSATHAFQGLGLRPLSPVHLQGKRNPSNGDWTFLWVRRTRLGGDSWDSVEVPLAEEAERYRLDILDAPGGEVLRSVEVTQPTFLYTAAMQTADYGAPQWNVPIRVAQVSPVYGAGVPAEQLTYDYRH